MHYVKMLQVKPRTFPTDLIQKDWSKRTCYGFEPREGEGQQITDIIHDLKVREDDVFVITMPKCGTTWMQELAWLVLNDYNFECAKTVPSEIRSPHIELSFAFEKSVEKGLQLLENTKSPRLLKSHRSLAILPKELWTKKPKLICVVRDPRDAFVSFYHFKRGSGYEMNYNLEQSIRANMDYELKTDEWFKFYSEFYALRNEAWIYYTSYEKMKKNLRGVILEVCQFLDKPINDKQMEKMLKHLSFEEMKNNPQVNLNYTKQRMREYINLIEYDDNEFIRKGRIGSYKEELSPELIEQLNTWLEDSLRRYNLTLEQLLND